MKRQGVALAGIRGAVVFMDTYMHAPADADLEFATAYTNEPPHTPLLVVTLSHPSHPWMQGCPLALTLMEARAAATAAEQTMHEFADHPEALELTNLILGLRAAADAMEARADSARDDA